MSQSSLISKSAKAPSSSRVNQVQTYPNQPYYPHLNPVFESANTENRYKVLFKSADWIKPAISSLAPHLGTMCALGIRNQVFDMFGTSSLDIANIMGLPMYKNLVYEFLASFAVTHGARMLDENSAWEFRIQNQNFRWTRKEVAEHLGFPMFGLPASATLEQRFKFWTKLTGLDHFGTYSSPYSIRCEGWRYVHRLVATNINSKPETVDEVTVTDLNIMWALDEGAPIDWFDVFSERFRSMQDKFGIQKYVGCTSLITYIAKKCGFQFYCTPDEYRELDHACLKKLRLLARSVFEDLTLTDVSEEPSEEESEEKSKDKQQPHKPPNDIPESSNQQKKKRKMGGPAELNAKVPWEGVRRVTVYEF